MVENGYSRSKKIDQGIEKSGYNVVSQSRENVRTSCSGFVIFILKSLRRPGSERITKITSSLIL